ncbi:MAG: hypothetical protein ACKOFH_09625 [Chthoniobacterales bacterium]
MDAQLVIPTLVGQGAIAASQSQELLEAMAASGRTPEDFLINEGHVDEHTFYTAIANSIGAGYIDLSDFELESRLRDKIPVGLARLHRALPVAEVDGTIYVAFSDPLDSERISELRFAIDQNIAVSVAPVARIEELIGEYYDSIDFATEGFSSLTQKELRQKLSEAGTAMAAGGLTDEE